MTAYAGTKSHDAEIVLDFVNKHVTMDYSLNKLGSPHQSNTSAVFNNTIIKLSIYQRLKEWIKFLLIVLFSYVPVTLIMPIMTTLLEHNILTNTTIHYWFQKWLKYSCVSTRGLIEQSKDGKLYEPILTFHIPHNVWFEYNLDGDYQDKIKSVALKRCFYTHYVFGKYPQQQQKGWNIIFEFTDIPQNGSCILKYI
jgi:hypothetical protein